MASRYEDCRAILRDRRFRTVDPRAWQSALQVEAAPEASRRVQEFMGRTMLFASPAAHGRLRQPLNHAFSPRVIEARRPRIRAIAEELASRLPTSGGFDFMAHFASPFPIHVVAELLGYPMEDREQVVAWIHTGASLLDPIQRPEAVESSARAMEAFAAYTRALLRRRRGPQEDLISLMQEPAEDGSVLTEDELVANIAFILAAGHETTAHLIGNGVWLLEREGLWDSLPSEARALGGVVGEILRFEPPVQMTIREAMEPVFVANRRVEKGRRVVALLGAANRDPAAFAEPDRFRPERSPNEHLAFSAGAHYCLGASLATVEGQEALAALRRVAPTLRLEGEGTWQPTITMRGFERLPARIA